MKTRSSSPHYSRVLAALISAAFMCGGALLSAQSADEKSETIVSAEPKAADNYSFSYGVRDVVKMLDAKVDPQVVIAYINNSSVVYNLTADEVVALKQRSKPVPDDVISTMLEHGTEMRNRIVQSLGQTAQGAAESAPAPAPAAEPAPEQTTPITNYATPPLRAEAEVAPVYYSTVYPISPYSYWWYDWYPVSWGTSFYFSWGYPYWWGCSWYPYYSSWYWHYPYYAHCNYPYYPYKHGFTAWRNGRENGYQGNWEGQGRRGSLNARGTQAGVRPQTAAATRNGSAGAIQRGGGASTVTAPRTAVPGSRTDTAVSARNGTAAGMTRGTQAPLSGSSVSSRSASSVATVRSGPVTRSGGVAAPQVRSAAPAPSMQTPSATRNSPTVIRSSPSASATRSSPSTMRSSPAVIRSSPSAGAVYAPRSAPAASRPSGWSSPGSVRSSTFATRSPYSSFSAPRSAPAPSMSRGVGGGFHSAPATMSRGGGFGGASMSRPAPSGGGFGGRAGGGGGGGRR